LNVHWLQQFHAEEAGVSPKFDFLGAWFGSLSLCDGDATKLRIARFQPGCVQQIRCAPYSPKRGLVWHAHAGRSF